MLNASVSLLETHEIRVRGTVQGVGFRPTVFRLAAEENLVGEVFNDAEGVLIRISGNRVSLQNFVEQLNLESPPLAKIDAIESKALDGNWNYSDFRISHSEQGQVSTQVSADAATCAACLEELFNPDERRYGYPFTNCTHCGPRISIVKRIPYDRENSTMAPFAMCEQCLQEYEDPLDRRFHAQPIACFDCGPKIGLIALDETGVTNVDIDGQSKMVAQNFHEKRDRSSHLLKQVNESIAAGKIVAIRGIGGFHLCCDASNPVAVENLRTRKQRYAKPFALMTHDLEVAKAYCHLSEFEAEQLKSSAAPIVLLDRKELTEGVPVLSEHIAPGSNLYGFMLPYTPLHWLLAKNFGKPLVMTSGNLSQQPQIIDNQEAIEQLSGIADLILYHDRDIANRIDDSVVRCVVGEARVMRRARGFAPRPFILPEGFERSSDILACGAELKSTFCLVKDGAAMVSQHQGDLEDLNTFDDYVKNLNLYQQLYDLKPKVIAVDQHPEYISSKFANNELIPANNAQRIAVQHHHAHIASCLVENQLPLDTPTVLGIALDGLGYGGDDTLWGGEFILADYHDYLRIGRFKPVAMLGGAQAIKEPWRNSYTHVLNAMSWNEFREQYADLDLYQFLQEKPLELLERMLDQGINSPLASSCGRLFDAVAAAVGLCRSRAQYEGQGAIELEMQATYVGDSIKELETEAYSFGINTNVKTASTTPLIEIDPAIMWTRLLNDIQKGVDVPTISARFHAGMIDAIFSVIQTACKQHSIKTVALSGGCLQNKILLEGLTKRVRKAGLTCLSQRHFPANDGGISLGQAAIAAAAQVRGQQSNQNK